MGFGINFACMWILHRGDAEHNLNLKSVMLHVVADIFRGLGICVAAILVWIWDWNWADSVCTIVVGVFMILGAFKVLREAYVAHMELNAEEAPKGEYV
mmetsp:Transcript_37783/g.81908  ORF Transcript_37783/g.81908 Transcript_37783/m.81908 type:complete len:98 (+) Transcript_37783:480-773(+)